MLDFFKAIILTLVVLAIIFGIQTLVFWGIGNLIIYAFGIDFTWTILHGFVVSLVVTVLAGMFKN